MDAILWAYFAITFLLTLTLGVVQITRPTTDLAPPQSANACGYVAVSLIGIQAIVSVATLHGTSAFPLAALFVAFTLLCHHSIIHQRSSFEGETCSCAPFQCKDVSNHETWVVASLVAAAVSQLGV